MVLPYLSRYVLFLFVRLLCLHKLNSYSHDQTMVCRELVKVSPVFVFIFSENDCDSFLLSGSWNCPRYSRKRHGQPHRLAAQCGHDAAAYGSSRSRQEDWNSMLWHHSWQKGNLLLKKLRHDPFGYMPLFSFVMFLLSVFKVLTKDLGGNSKCSEFTEAICQRVRDMN